MVKINTIDISPPLLNSSCAWASDFEQLSALYTCQYTGAITTRTATLNGFAENDTNTVVFSTPSGTSLNSYGYSPHSLKLYTSWVFTLLTSRAASTWKNKPIIISITAPDPTSLETMLSEITDLKHRLRQFDAGPECGDAGKIDPSALVAVELNTSCPNIKDAPPPAYNFTSLLPLLDVLAAAYHTDRTLTFGLKLPPYIYATSFQEVIHSISTYSRPGPNSSEEAINPFAFITCTNTLGSCMLFSTQVDQNASRGDPPSFALPTPLGGLGGDALHPLALGNVHTFAQLFAQHPDPSIRRIAIIGVGGVTSPEARQRMVQAGASAVACATLLGQHGVKAFELLKLDDDKEP